MIRWPERLLAHQIHHEIIAHSGVVAHTLFEGEVSFQKLQNGDVAACVVHAGLHALVDLRFLLAQFCQCGGIDRLPLAEVVRIPILIKAVLALAFASFQGPTLVVFSFGHSSSLLAI